MAPMVLVDVTSSRTHFRYRKGINPFDFGSLYNNSLIKIYTAPRLDYFRVYVPNVLKDTMQLTSRNL